MTATTPLEAATIEEAAGLLAKRAVFLRLTKQAMGLSDIVEPIKQKATELADTYVPQAKALYQQHSMPINAGLIGGGLGAAVGGLSGMTSPDETRRKPLRSALMGGLAGGAIGLGGGIVASQLPQLKGLFGQSKTLDDVQGAAEAHQGLLGKIRPEGGPGIAGVADAGAVAEKLVPDVPGIRVLKPSHTPFYAKPVQELGGDYAGQAAKFTLPAHAAYEAARGAQSIRNSISPLTTSNMQTGALEYLKDPARLKSLAEELRIHPSGLQAAVPGIEDNLRGAFSRLQGERVPVFNAARSLEKTDLAGLLKAHGPSTPGAWESVMRNVGETGRKANLSATAGPGAIMSGGLRAGGRLGAHAGLLALLSLMQPKAGPIIQK